MRWLPVRYFGLEGLVYLGRPENNRGWEFDRDFFFKVDVV